MLKFEMALRVDAWDDCIERFDEERFAGIIVTRSVTQKMIRIRIRLRTRKYNSDVAQTLMVGNVTAQLTDRHALHVHRLFAYPWY